MVGSNQAVDSRVVAARFLELAEAAGNALTQLQLQKLVYYAHGWHLAVHGSALTRDDLEAWQYGPAYENLWTALRDHGKRALKRNCLDADTSRLTKSQRELIQAVYDAYGVYGGFQLSSMSHRAGSPWHTKFERGKRRKIDDATVRKYFSELPTGEAT